MAEVVAHELEGAGQASPLDTDPTDSSPVSHQRTSSLDGIRAFAVLSVIAYHAGISWFGGGLLGVDVFFVLSGFLITSLICRELRRSNTIRLGRFWAQRARRLLPALFVLLVGVAVYAYAFRSTLDLKSIRGDALATLFYVSNWHFIVSDQGYFAQAAAPSPLLHTWSLAVEEQYYLIWPLIALIVVRLRGINALAIVAAMGAGASALLMGTMYWAGVSVDRLYYGTDTRAQALLIGSFLGAVGSHTGSTFNILPTSWTRSRLQQRFWVLLGIVGAIFLVWAWHDLQGQTSALYVGGFFCVGLAVSSVIVACITFPASMLARLCSLSVLVYIGRISYGLYLYHWPLFLAIDHAHTGLMGFPLLVARLAATFCAASISFFAIEEPIRRRRVLKGRIAWSAMGAAVVVSVVALFFATVTPALATVPVRGANAMTTAETRSLRAAGAFTTHPIKFLLLGDSIALTLGTGLSNRSVSRYGVEMIDKGAAWLRPRLGGSESVGFSRSGHTRLFALENGLDAIHCTGPPRCCRFAHWAVGGE